MPLQEKVEIAEGRRRRKAKPKENAFNLTEQNKFTVISRQVITKTLRCGFSYSVKPRLIKEGARWIAEFEYKFESSTVSEFLSHTLGVPRDSIIEGNITNIHV